MKGFYTFAYDHLQEAEVLFDEKLERGETTIFGARVTLLMISK